MRLFVDGRAFDHQDEGLAGDAVGEDVDGALGHQVEHGLIGIALEIGDGFGGGAGEAELVIGNVHVGVTGGGDAVACGRGDGGTAEDADGGLSVGDGTQLGSGGDVAIAEVLEFGDEVALIGTAGRDERIETPPRITSKAGWPLSMGFSRNWRAISRRAWR